MKRTLLILTILVFAAIVVAVALIGTTTTTVVLTDGTTTCVEGGFITSPSWLEAMVGGALWVGIVIAIGAAFLPFGYSRRELPIFFRAHIFVPCLFAMWVCAGSLFPFSPHQLTRTMPDFLLGADDWGVGNIYTYTKLADWLALLAGCAACGHLAIDSPMFAGGFAKLLRLCLPHLVAALALHLVPSIFECGIHNALVIDDGVLFLWLLVGFGAIIALQSLANSTRQWLPRLLSWLAATGWLFVPVAISRP